MINRGGRVIILIFDCCDQVSMVAPVSRFTLLGFILMPMKV